MKDLITHQNTSKKIFLKINYTLLSKCLNLLKSNWVSLEQLGQLLTEKNKSFI